MTTQVKRGRSLVAAVFALALITGPQLAGAEEIGDFAPTPGSGRVAALPAPAAIPQEAPAMTDESMDPSYGWTEFSVGADAFGGTAAANPHPYYGIPTELDVE